jgi:hypothetical protein
LIRSERRLGQSPSQPRNSAVRSSRCFAGRAAITGRNMCGLCNRMTRLSCQRGSHAITPGSNARASLGPSGHTLYRKRPVCKLVPIHMPLSSVTPVVNTAIAYILLNTMFVYASKYSQNRLLRTLPIAIIRFCVFTNNSDISSHLTGSPRVLFVPICGNFSDTPPLPSFAPYSMSPRCDKTRWHLENQTNEGPTWGNSPKTPANARSSCSPPDALFRGAPPFFRQRDQPAHK